MQEFFTKAGGLLNRITGGPQQLGLGALLYGSSQIQEPLKRTFGLPTTGDYLRQWESQKTAPAKQTNAGQQQRPIGTQAVLNGKPVYWGGDDYGWQLLNRTGSSATLNSLNAPGTQGRFIQDTAPRSPGAAQGGGGGFSGAGSFAPIDPYAAQNREYERERARVEAMVKANPDMQKQAIADERAKVRDQGMAIWAAANPDLAKQVKPGAVGYDVIQQGLLSKDAGQAARQAFGYQTPQQITFTPPPGVNTPQGFPAVQSITPTETYGAQGLQTDPEMLKKFQALLNSRTK
jgi:hypothetical protein